MENHIIYGIIKINKKDYPFFFEKRTIRIVDSSAIYMDDFKEIEKLEAIYGVTSDGRAILFLDCTFQKILFGVYGNTIIIGSYMLSNGDNHETDFMDTEKIVFYSDAINMFYSPLNARKFISESNTSLEESWRKIEILPYQETLKSFTYNDNEYAFGIGGFVNLESGTERLGELRSCLEINFSKPIHYTDVLKHTQNVYDFLRFLNYSSNIRIEAIDLFKKRDGGGTKKYATYHIFQDSTEYENNAYNSITISDFDISKLGTLYGCIISLREFDNKIHLYYPKNKHDRRFIHPVDWLTKALVFEGLFESRYPNFKSQVNDNFAKAKSAVIDTISRIQGENKHQRGYLSDISYYVKQYNGNLEGKFNHVMKENDGILEPILSFNQQEYSVKTDFNYGKIYMDYRNCVAHGDVQPLGDPQIAVYRVLEAMVYLLLIKDVGFSDDEKKIIIKKLFV